MRMLFISLAFVAIVSVATAKPHKHGGKNDEQSNLFYDDYWTKRYVEEDNSFSDTKYSSKDDPAWKKEPRPLSEKQTDSVKKTAADKKYESAKQAEIQKALDAKKKSMEKEKILREKKAERPASKHSDTEFAQKSLQVESSLNDKIYEYAKQLHKEKKSWDFSKFNNDLLTEKDYKEIDDEINERNSDDSDDDGDGEEGYRSSQERAEVGNKLESSSQQQEEEKVNKIPYGDDMVYPDSSSSEKREVNEVHPIEFADPVEYTEKHHSVKKNLYNSEYLKEYAKTKPDLKTSPNPPPPGLGNDHSMMVTPSGKKPKASKKEAVYIESVPLEKCEQDYDCRMGRMCHKGICVCLDIGGCFGHYKPVCGSDGQWYPSHCELHRSACIRHDHIKIDHKNTCVKSQDQKSTNEVPVDPQLKIDNALTNIPFPGKPENSAEIHDNPEETQRKKKKEEERKLKKVDDEEERKPAASLKMSDRSFYDYLRDKNMENEEEKKCTKEEYIRFKEILLKYHCVRFAEQDCNVETHEKRDYLATLMFSIYDMNLDYYIDMKEAEQMEDKEHKQRDWSPCTIIDIIRNDDQDPVDNKLSVSEFVSAFILQGISNPVTVVVTEEFLPTLATVGNGLELKCGIADGKNIIWKRNDVDIKDLPTEELKVFEDGALYFSKIGVHHMGNYSCEDKTDPSLKQVHSLKVHMPPTVRVSPVTQMRVSQSDITIKCHAEGIPAPKIMWQVNEIRIPDSPDHYVKTHANGTLIVENANYKRDTGAYKCIAENQAGKAEGVASVFIQDPHNKKEAFSNYHKPYGTFVVFHDKGYTVYDPSSCLIQRDATGEFGSFKFIPDNLDGPLKMCDPKIGCHWGSAVNINNQYVYVSQPKENRIIIIESAEKWNPIQVIDTDKTPVKLHYIAHLDQVWVLCWNGENDGSTKTVVVIRDASKYIQHHSVHTQPVGNRFDLVQDLFLPPANDLHHNFNFGYVTHSGREELFKIDLRTMKYISTIDVSKYDCIPKSLTFVAIGGHIIIECIAPQSHESHQMLLDYVTDAVVRMTPLSGKPYVSPDSRYVVTINSETGKVFVSRVSEQGALETAFELTVSNNIGDVTFFPSSKSKGYDLVLTSADNSDIIFLSLANGKVEKLKSHKDTEDKRSWKPSPVVKEIASGSIFSDFLMTPTPSSVRIIDGKHHQLQCEFSGPLNSHVILFVEN